MTSPAANAAARHASAARNATAAAYALLKYAEVVGEENLAANARKHAERLADTAELHWLHHDLEGLRSVTRVAVAAAAKAPRTLAELRHREWAGTRVRDINGEEGEALGDHMGAARECCVRFDRWPTEVHTLHPADLTLVEPTADDPTVRKDHP
ncbi:hypothetical protein [Corynebacterium pygosceleis]|uniref:hypothetical protein n=1 Tax=Corynebacterium pygosceleis TaxID=2800406 RepID=UPI0020040A5B|nr:hypothetical protein [Corynebacterium pygosceleis]MCK7676392.1 hypothetical protein [Corynebacterium pygosceleis]